jgi:hypothetical protein
MRSETSNRTPKPKPSPRHASILIYGTRIKKCLNPFIISEYTSLIYGKPGVRTFPSFAISSHSCSPLPALEPQARAKINRKPGKIEHLVSHRKQRAGAPINRKLSRGPHFPFSTFTFLFSNSARLLRQRTQLSQFPPQIHECAKVDHRNDAEEGNRERRHRPAAHLSRAGKINCRERRQKSGQRQRHHHQPHADAFHRCFAIPSAIRAVRAFGGVFGPAMTRGTLSIGHIKC